MPVRFVLGRAGSGKTEHCFRAIVDAMRDDPFGPPLDLAAAQAGDIRSRTRPHLPKRAGRFCRARVVSFEQFGRDISEDCGGTTIPEITPLGRQMIIGHLLRQNRTRLRFYSKVARQPGLALELDSTFAEFERAGKSCARAGSVNRRTWRVQRRRSRPRPVARQAARRGVALQPIHRIPGPGSTRSPSPAGAG